MNRFKQIDILRALAVFLVLGRHMIQCPVEVNPFLHRITSIWAQGGWIGVDLFFVLSGFLVSGLLFREYEKYHELQIGRFLIRRGFKIYPPFWLLIGVTVVLTLAHHRPVPVPAVISELLFVQNYGPAILIHSWSLAVEEHFYLLLALAFFLLIRRRTSEPFRFIPIAFALVALLCLALRIYVNHHFPYSHKTHIFPTHLRLDGLFFGVLLSYGYHRHPAIFIATARRLRYVLAITGVLMLVPAFCLPLKTSLFIPTFGLTLFYLASGALVIAAMGAANPRTFFGKGLAYVGSHSYSVYLWHMQAAIWGAAIVRRLPEHYKENWYISTVVYLVGSVCLGIVLAILIEFPVLRIRDRLFPSRGLPLSAGDTKPNNPQPESRPLSIR